jgi:putative heme transporter
MALPVFVLSFFGGFIPYIGGAVTTLIAFLVAVSAGTPFDILIMGIWTVVFNLVQGNIVAPLVYGRTTHIHPAVVLVAIPAGAAVAGIAGMFVVVPAIGVVATTWRTVLSLLATHADKADVGSTAVEPGPDPVEAPLARNLPGSAAPEPPG